MGPPDKRELLAAVREAVALELEAMRRTMARTREASTHEEAKPENDKDTRALELSYLERGQALRVRELEAALQRIDRTVPRGFAGAQPIALTALVTLEEDDGGEMRAFMAPAAGGLKLASDPTSPIAARRGLSPIVVVTPESPLGKALLGKVEDDEADVTTAGKRRVYRIARVE